MCDGCSVFVRVCTEVRLERQPKECHRAERVPCIPPRPFPCPAMFSSRQQRCYLFFIFTNHLLPFTIAITARSTPEMWPSIFAKMKVRFKALCTVLLPVLVCARGCVLGGLKDILYRHTATHHLATTLCGIRSTAEVLTLSMRIRIAPRGAPSPLTSRNQSIPMQCRRLGSTVSRATSSGTTTFLTW